jgi:outer membrane immunogenic protein
MKKFFLAAASVLALSTAAHASDLTLPAKAPVYDPPPPILTWTGGYFGIQGGVARHDSTVDANCAPNLSCGTTERTKAGSAIGALVGYNWQQGGFVYGLEGDWSSLGGLRTSETGIELSTAVDVRWVATARGRAGLAFDATLVYITGGLAFGRVDNSIVANIGDGGLVGSFIDDKTRVGWTAGVGVEHMLAPHWTLRGEWRYVDLGTSDIACAHGNDLCTGAHADFSNTLMMGLVGLAYKF